MRYRYSHPCRQVIQQLKIFKKLLKYHLQDYNDPILGRNVNLQKYDRLMGYYKKNIRELAQLIRSRRFIQLSCA